MLKTFFTKKLIKMPEFLKDSQFQTLSSPRHIIGNNHHQGHYPPFISNFTTSSSTNSESSSASSTTSSSSNSLPNSFQPPSADSESYVKVRMPNIKGFFLNFNFRKSCLCVWDILS